MGIQPIDLQNMYSQMSNIARNVAGQQQAAQVSESVQQLNQIQKDLEQSQRVNQANNDKANTNNVNPEGHKGGARQHHMLQSVQGHRDRVQRGPAHRGGHRQKLSEDTRGKIQARAVR